MARSILQFGQVNVKYYGALGDGMQDDTAAINSAIAAIPATGGLLIFPPGTYVTSGGFTLANPTKVIGFGKAGFDGTTGAISKITCTSQTASLFTVSAYHASFENIALVNTYNGTPTAGAGITVASDNLLQRVDYESVSVSGFYIDIDVQVGTAWKMNNCWLFAPVLYGIKIANTENGDAGDWGICNSDIWSSVYEATAAIHIESSGGGKITNTKINMGIAPFKTFTNGIELAVAAQTSILEVSNCSIENVDQYGIAVTTNSIIFDKIIIMGNQFGMWLSSSPAISIVAANQNEITGVSILGNVFFSNAAVAAISLTKVVNASIGPNVIVGGYTAQLSQTSCSAVTEIPTP
jgi:hypothetical protein